MCQAGRGPLDEAACSPDCFKSMGSERGFAACGWLTRKHRRARRDWCGEVCLSYLELIGSPSHLSYLVRRFRLRLPEVPILVGFWPDETEILKDDRMRAAIGADFYTSSLHKAIGACLDAAYKV
jgi:hypothetical protein